MSQGANQRFVCGGSGDGGDSMELPCVLYLEGANVPSCLQA